MKKALIALACLASIPLHAIKVHCALTSNKGSVYIEVNEQDKITALQKAVAQKCEVDQLQVQFPTIVGSCIADALRTTDREHIKDTPSQLFYETYTIAQAFKQTGYCDDQGVMTLIAKKR